MDLVDVFFCQERKKAAFIVQWDEIVIYWFSIDTNAVRAIV